MASKIPAGSPAGKGPSKAPTPKPIPTKYTARCAILSYIDSSSNLMTDPGSWTVLETQAESSNANNVGPVVFEGPIQITQKSGNTKCTLDYPATSYSDVQIIEGAKPSDPVTITFCVVGEASIRYEPDVPDANTMSLPLAYKSFRYVRLTFHLKNLTSTGVFKTNVPGEMIGHLKVLTTGQERFDVNNPWNRVFEEDNIVLRTEAKAQEAQLGKFDKCRIVTKLHAS
ncbi:MAG: hypothetical protein Q9174_004114, partial [Haloplaca sp. 1 TL-2023]